VAVAGAILLAIAAVAWLVLRDDPGTADLPSPRASPTSASTPSPSSAPSESAAASAVASQPAGEVTSVFDLETGDCFLAPEGEQASEVSVVPCDATHIYEAFHVFDHEAGPDEPYPGDEELLNYADGQCRGPFEDYVGIDYDDSIYWITSVSPSEDTWADGDREIVCALKLGQDGEETTGSAEGAGE
jgi:hypothetical protein